MKKILVIAIASLTILALNSCSSKNKLETPQLEGEWISVKRMVNLEGTSHLTKTINKELEKFTFEREFKAGSNDGEGTLRYIVKNKKTGQTVIDDEGKYTYKGGILIIKMPREEASTSETLTLSRTEINSSQDITGQYLGEMLLQLGLGILVPDSEKGKLFIQEERVK